MKDDVRKEIAECSRQIDNLERTKNLIKTSNVLCFTTMDRGPEETVSIELLDGQTIKHEEVNSVIETAKKSMEDYLDGKIRQLNEKIDKVLEESV